MIIKLRVMSQWKCVIVKVFDDYCVLIAPIIIIIIIRVWNTEKQ